MRVISIVNTKGGGAKTTLASTLAVCAARDGKRVAMVDLDPQASLIGWWKRRGSPPNPAIVGDIETASEAVERLGGADAPDYCIIDTPPAFIATIQDAIENADLALIPLKASALDLIASEDAVLMAREAGVAHLCVVSDAEPRWKTTHAAADYLLAAGVPVADTVITHRQAYLAAMTSGRTGPEIEKGKERPAEAEVAALWSEVKAALRKAEKERAA